MPFNFTCPYCFKRTLVEDALAGQSGPCAGCGKTVTLPSKSPQATAPDASSPDTHFQPSGASATSSQIRRRFDPRVTAWAVKLAVYAIIAAALLVAAWFTIKPSLVELRLRRDRFASMNNLQRIAAALNSYAARYGSYPPPVVYDTAGKPMHSWRVLILEDLGEASLYARYDFKQPWDAPSNVQLLGSQCPRVYISPTIGYTRNVSETNYFLVTGRNTVFPPEGPLAPDQIRDGTGNTLLVFEAENTTTEWTKPVDIDYSKLKPIGAMGPNAIGGLQAGGAVAVFADGQPAWLPSDMSPLVLDAMITPSGGEPVVASDFYPNAQP